MSIIACDGTIDDPIPEYDVLATVNEDDGQKNYLVYGSAYFQLIIILFVYSICLFIKTINVNVVGCCVVVCCFTFDARRSIKIPGLPKAILYHSYNFNN